MIKFGKLSGKLPYKLGCFIHDLQEWNFLFPSKRRPEDRFEEAVGWDSRLERDKFRNKTNDRKGSRFERGVGLDDQEERMMKYDSN